MGRFSWLAALAFGVTGFQKGHYTATTKLTINDYSVGADAFGTPIPVSSNPKFGDGWVRVDHAVSSGTFSLDGGTWDVDNNVWLVGDDDECVVIDAAHDAGAILAAVGLEAIGLGPNDVTTLGTTIYWAEKFSAVLRGQWWWWGPPIVAISFIFVGLFLLSAGLDRIANPKLRQQT